ncbi:MAG: calcium-translocating P-type ATPase, PMCA-type [Bacilli bacterium]|nr:calcium-translocating P-type ATPase, PMCA-type [Bacilli bacterium]
MNYSSMSIIDIERELVTDLQLGLHASEVARRQREFGKNVISESKKRTFFQMFLEQISDFMVLTLIGAAIISFLLGEKQESILIIVIVVVNAFLGIIQEYKAEKSLEAIKKLASVHARVIRGGKLEIIDASELVVGDIVLIEAGDYVPADMRLIEVNNLKVDESPLTGESVPVEKDTEVILSDNVPISERKNIAFKGTYVTYGSGKGIVHATGMQAEIGKIAEMIASAEELQTPMQKSLEHLGKVLLIMILAICAIIFFIGISKNQGIFEMFITVVSLAVAAIPEGLPAIVTIVLALGMQRMAKHHAIIRKLPAVETLGITDVICSDKTGTLTQNKMTITQVFVNNDIISLESKLSPSLERMIVYGVLCNNAKITSERDFIGDPTDVAFMHWATHYDLSPHRIIDDYQKLYEIPFSSERKLMTTVNSINGKKFVITKGAFEKVLEISKNIYLNDSVHPLINSHKNKLIEANEKFTNQALRVIAIGYKVLNDDEELDDEKLEKGLTFVGFVGMIDPPRVEVYDAIKKCKNAGIETIMITGDHKNTALAIANQLGMLNYGDEAITGTELDNLSDRELERRIKNIRVYARVTPEHKVRIVKAWKKQNKIVAMTGDGINDAPALKQADIGVAMGLSGTEVAKEASDMILTDDNFATIVKAVEEGRIIFVNIRKAIKFLLSCNVGEILTVLLGALLGSFLYGHSVNPLTPVQLLWGNLVTDSLIAIAIGLEKAEPDLMKKKIVNHGLIDFESGIMIIFQGILIGFISFAAYHIGYRMNGELLGSTMAFMTLTITQLFHAFNIRSENYSIFKIGVFSNKYIIFAFVLNFFLQLGTIIHPFTRKLFDTVMLTPKQFIIVLLLTILPVLVVEFGKAFHKE